MMSLEIPFVLFSNCFPVKGIARSIICDVQRNKYSFIPNSLYDLLIVYNGQPICSIFSQFSNLVDQTTIKEYFEFLLDEEFIFFTNNPDAFPPLEIQWQHPSAVTNAIIDIGDNYEKFDYEKLICDLSDLGCKGLEIRIYSDISRSFLLELIHFNAANKIRDVQLILKYESSEKKFLARIYETNTRISSISIHSAPLNDHFCLSNSGLHTVFFSTRKLDSASHCGAINLQYFSINIDTYMESHLFNSCLNRKVGIDIDGNIKNCPTLKKEFGNITNSSIKDVVVGLNFQKPWHITKDQIEICRDCEFRYICTDCRSNADGIFNDRNKPEKCGYDPYTMTWIK
jgi:SPASM domain peptide maturase of grasp-with-spasm system